MHPTDRWTTSFALCASLLFSVLATAATSPPDSPPPDAPPDADAPQETSWLLTPQPLRPALRAPLSDADARAVTARGGLLLVGLSADAAAGTYAGAYADTDTPPCTVSVTLGGHTQHQAVLLAPDQHPEDPTLLTFPLWSGGGDLQAPLRWLTLRGGDALTLRAADACDGALLGVALLFGEAAAHAEADPRAYWEGALYTLPAAPPPAPPSPAPAPSMPDAALGVDTLWACF